MTEKVKDSLTEEAEEVVVKKRYERIRSKND